MLHRQTLDEVERLLEILQHEGALLEVDDDPIVDLERKAAETVEFIRAETKQ